MSRWGGGGGACSVVKAACLESRRTRARLPLWHSNFKETKCSFPAHSWRFNIVRSHRNREVACLASDRRCSNVKSCVWRAVSSHSSQHTQEVLLAQISLYGPIYHLSAYWISRTNIVRKSYVTPQLQQDIIMIMEISMRDGGSILGQRLPIFVQN